MSTIKDKVANAGQAIADTAKNAGHAVAECASQAKDWVKEKAGIAGADPSAIKPHMEVIASCGCKVGTVDHTEGNAIKLTKSDSPDGQHHFVPTGWVARVDEHVHLNKNADEAKQGWKSDAASCASCGA